MSVEFALDTQSEREFVCACEEWMRSACAREGFFREHEGRSYCVLHYPNQDKTTAFNSVLQKKLEAKDFDFRGVWFPEGASFSRVQFNAPADFSCAIFSGVANFFKAVFTADTRFGTADVSFNNATFRADADFRFTNFSIDADFAKTQYSAIADFSSAKFKRSVFGAAKFSSNAIFSFAKFEDDAFFYSANFGATTKFQETTFNARADFSNATFSADADFASAIFTADADFNHSTFASYVRFAGNKDQPVFGDCSYLNLQHARIEKPERASFHSLKLRPHWFINVDARKFEFVNVRWTKGRKREIAGLRHHVGTSSYYLLSIAYRQLAINAEENHRYREASEFRYWAMDMQRLESLRGEKVLAKQWSVFKRSAVRIARSLVRENSLGRLSRTRERAWSFLKIYWFRLQTLHWLYWLASGYGERITRAVMVLFVLWILFAGAYCVTGFERKPTPSMPMVTVVSDEVRRPLPLTKALTYSLGVMSLQKPEPRPVTSTGQTLVTLEAILGPLQAALLALAIRRKFMR